MKIASGYLGGWKAVPNAIYETELKITLERRNLEMRDSWNDGLEDFLVEFRVSVSHRYCKYYSADSSKPNNDV